MAALEKGITKNGTGYSGKTWNILGQVYFPKAVTDSTFAFETNSDPGQFVPVHIHPTQEEFILVQDGILDLKLDGVWVQAKNRRSGPAAPRHPARLFQQIGQTSARFVLGVTDAEARGVVQPVAQSDRCRGNRPDLGRARGELPAARGQRVIAAGGPRLPLQIALSIKLLLVMRRRPVSIAKRWRSGELAWAVSQR
jgi:hypothetical protein